ncbi:hypothetical protein AB0K15_21270 [Amycolatopsis sp. NPDC049253]|uniref:hypothetical protein n=1 Tax=Amycolatopsis sp. NPDC049253 TaxID=3155274 RepID=UPI003412FD94
MKRAIRAWARAITGCGWVLAPPSAPFDVGFVVPAPRPAPDDVPSPPLSRRERRAFRRIVHDYAEPE